MLCHYKVILSPKVRGFHLITAEILAALPDLPQNAMMNVFIQHTSAALSINENADPSVRHDFDTVFDKLVPENQSYYTHTAEGPDDMPAHIKSALLGFSVTIPIIDGKFALGTWQDIYLCEFRNSGGSRRLIVTIYE